MAFHLKQKGAVVQWRPPQNVIDQIRKLILILRIPHVELLPWVAFYLPGPAGVSAVWFGSERAEADWLPRRSLSSSRLQVCEDRRWTCLSCCCCCLSAPEQAAWVAGETVRVWPQSAKAVSDWQPSELWWCWETTLKTHKGLRNLASSRNGTVKSIGCCMASLRHLNL